MTTSKRFVVIPTEGDCYFYSCDGETLPALQALVGGLVDVVNLGRDVDMWVNDEGRYTQPLNLGASLTARQPIYGVAVLAGSNDEGETISLPDVPGLSDLPGHSISDEDAVNLMVDAMEMWAMFAQVRMVAEITSQDPRSVLAGILSGDKPTGKPHAAAADLPSMAGNVRYGYL